jgi:hypothetical protein
MINYAAIFAEELTCFSNNIIVKQHTPVSIQVCSVLNKV